MHGRFARPAKGDRAASGRVIASPTGRCPGHRRPRTWVWTPGGNQACLPGPPALPDGPENGECAGRQVRLWPGTE